MFLFPDAYTAESTPLRITSLPAVTQSSNHFEAFDRLRRLHVSLSNVTQDIVITNNKLTTLDKIKSLSESWGLPDISEWVSAIAWSTVLTAWCALNTAGLILVYKKQRVTKGLTTLSELQDALPLLPSSPPRYQDLPL